MRGSRQETPDKRHLPQYSIPEASHYLLVPQSTIRWWVTGRTYHPETGKQQFSPIINLPQERTNLLSFINLTEIHVLDVIRRQPRISFPKIRRALNYLERTFSSRHPLADQRFQTDGADLFIERYGQLIALTREGQLAMRNMLEAYLKRIDRDEDGLPARLYPFTRKRELDEPKAVVIDPRVSFGRPVLAGTGVKTAVIAERFKAGDDWNTLAEDYGLSTLQIQEAIRCELSLEAA